MNTKVVTLKYNCVICHAPCLMKGYYKTVCSLQCRFLSHIDKTETCWNWKASITKSRGYGAFKINKHKVLAHRYAYELFKGPIENGKYVLHSCDNRICQNPEHLWLGTNDDNMQDKMKKKRYWHKLTVENILEIRRLFSKGDITRKELAIRFNVTVGRIGQIIRIEAWKHV